MFHFRYYSLLQKEDLVCYSVLCLPSCAQQRTVNGSELKEVMWVMSQSHESEWNEFLSVVVRWYRNDVFSFTARGAMYVHIYTRMGR